MSTIAVLLDSELVKKKGLTPAILHYWLTHISTITTEKRIEYEKLIEVFPFYSLKKIEHDLDSLAKLKLIEYESDKLGFTYQFKSKEKRSRKKAEEVRTEVTPVVQENRLHYIKRNKDGTFEEVNEAKGTVINNMIDCFKQVHPQYESFFKRSNHRVALEQLVALYEIEFIFELIDILQHTNGLQYFPTITTPAELGRNAPKLIAAIQRDMKKNVGNTTRLVSQTGEVKYDGTENSSDIYLHIRPYLI